MFANALKPSALFVLILALAACGDDSGTGTILDGGDDGIDDSSGNVDANDDADGTTQADGDEDLAPLDTGAGLAVGELCEADGDCDSSLCFQFEATTNTGFCTTYCSDATNCPDETYDCVFLANNAGDYARVCVPDTLCIDRDEDEFGLGPGCTGPDCDDEDESVYLGADELCDDKDNDCDGNVDDNLVGANDECDTGLPGACAVGRRLCLDGISDCAPIRVSTAELCDGIDNDCNGTIDDSVDGEPLSEVCYAGPEGTAGIGICTAGVRACNEGRLGECVGQSLPFPEFCDGEDNDCDGEIDDGAPGAGVACVTGLTGDCAEGTTVCGDDGIACVSTIAPGSRAEVCDGEDNDCNGAVDDGFANLGRSCFSGTGACRNAGVVACDPADPSAPTVCDAVAGEPNPVELCDYADDNCNGQTDEGWIGDDGRYTRNEACGNCFTDCTTILARPNGFGFCDSTGTPTCSLGCDPGYFNLNGIPDDGCEFALDGGSIYVSATDAAASDAGDCGLGPVGTGAGNFPCATIRHGLARASGSGRARVLVAAGSYTGTLTLVNGINLLGGYNPTNWGRDIRANTTTLFGDVASGHRKTIIADGINAATTLVEGFVIFGQNANGTGENSYAVWVRDSNANLALRSNTIFAGSGGPGSNGASGSSGAGGAAGGNGGNAYEPGIGANCAEQCNPSVERAGGVGGANTCGGVTASGGDGGRARCPDYDEAVNSCASCASGGRQTRNTDGLAAPGGGAGGIGGCDSLIDPDCTGDCSCYNPDDPDCPNGMAAIPGSNGPDGSQGSAGPAALDAIGLTAGGEWQGTAGAAGGSGSAGRGGGGGGAGGGVETYNAGCTNSGYSDIGGSGGGGGAGGCGGTAGGGGLNGGGSFGIFVTFAGDPGGNIPQFSANFVQRSFGGDGGDGGNGGVGGPGGRGGLGGLGGLSTSTFWCAVGGQKGGEGGDGGNGGGGGGGAGGASIGIWASGQGGSSLAAWSTGNVFLFGGAGGSGGIGGGTGPGGFPGGNGVAGASASTNF